MKVTHPVFCPFFLLQFICSLKDLNKSIKQCLTHDCQRWCRLEWRVADKYTLQVLGGLPSVFQMALTCIDLIWCWKHCLQTLVYTDVLAPHCCFRFDDCTCRKCCVGLKEHLFGCDCSGLLVMFNKSISDDQSFVRCFINPIEIPIRRSVH